MANKQTRKPAAAAPVQAPTQPAAPAPVQAPSTPNPVAGMVQTLLAQAQAAAQARAQVQPTAAPTPTGKPATVALRGGLAVQAVALTGKVYRVAAPHNVAWWATVQAQVAQGQGSATVQALVAAGVPAIMVGYLVRRGYCKPVQV